MLQLQAASMLPWYEVTLYHTRHIYLHGDRCPYTSILRTNLSAARPCKTAAGTMYITQYLQTSDDFLTKPHETERGNEHRQNHNLEAFCYLNLAAVMSVSEYVGQTPVVAISVGDQQQNQQKHPCAGCPMCVIPSCSGVLVLEKSLLALRSSGSMRSTS